MIKTMILTILFTALMLKAQPFAGSGTLGDPYQIGKIGRAACSERV